MKAVVMAGGHGTRLRPLTSSTPKPLLPIVNRPILEHVIDFLKSFEITELIFTVSYLADMIQSYFGDGSDFGVSIKYSVEQIPLGTAGSVLNVADQLKEDFLVISGDVLTNFNLIDLMGWHKNSSSIVSIALKQIDDPTSFGVVICDESNEVVRFVEKPTWGQVFSDTINTGVYVMSPEVFEFMVPGKELDFSSDIFPELLNHKKKISGFKMLGYWEDIGTHLAYLKAHRDVLDGKITLNHIGFELKEGVFIGENVDIHPTVRIDGPCMIGSNSTVDSNCIINPYSVLGSNVRIRQDSLIDHSIIMDNSFIGYRSSVRGSIVGRACEVRNNVTIEPECVLGDGCLVGNSVLIDSNVKVYSKKIIESGATVNSSIVFETRANRNLFGNLGIEGYSNVDISPEFAVKVAMAYGSLLPKGSRIVASRDSSRSARMLKRAMMIGFNAVGVDVEDLEISTIPTMSHTIVATGSDGGVTVRLSNDDPLVVSIRFFDINGMDIDEHLRKKIERLYFREEFRKVVGSEIGDLNLPTRAVEEYCYKILKSVDLEIIRKRNFKIVLNYSYGTVSFVMPNLLSKLNSDIYVINPYAATYKSLSVTTADLIEETGNLVRASGADFGVIFDGDGESILLVDDLGVTLSDQMLQLLIVKLLVELNFDTTIAVPITSTMKLDEIAKGSKVKILRTKATTVNYFEYLTDYSPDLIFGTESKYMILGYANVFDSAAMFCYLLELFSNYNLSVSTLLTKIGPIFTSRFEVPCSFDHKATFMREYSGLKSEYIEDDQIEGIKLRYPDGWIFVLPDSLLPNLNVFVESTSQKSLDELIKSVKSEIESLISGFDSTM